jgi:CDP-glucose 4,6-dehydratase
MTETLLHKAYRDKRVWISGHTGFKGSWLALWLLELGAKVYGYSHVPPTDPALFEQLNLAGRIHHEIGDVDHKEAVDRSIQSAQPDFVFHLAAQPLVRSSYDTPVQTYTTNVLGTIHVMEALRSLTRACAAVMVTTDKCYENREWLYGYREEDPLGGYDPYSSSKAAAEIAIGSWRRSFFQGHPVRIASARAGNVIGGGDWARDRIVPDCVRRLQRGEIFPVRNKVATRPWQHVLEPLSAYLWLGAVLADPSLRPFPREHFAAAFNFGPGLEANRTVAELVQEILKHWPGEWRDGSDPKARHEAKLLNLATDKAHHLLGWSPAWKFERAVAATARWYRTNHESGASPGAIQELTVRQIDEYQVDARERGVLWARDSVSN